MLKRMLIVVAALTVGGILQSQDVGKTEWTQWRGPDRDGRSIETGLLKQWPAGGPAKLWTISGLGEGYSGISVADGRIYVMGTRDGKEQLFCLDFDDGKGVWSTAVDDRIYQNNRGNGPRCTPTLDEERVYVESGNGIVSCLDAKTGKGIWQISLVADLGGRVPQWGYSESPLVDGNNLIVTPGGGRGSVVALNKKTGKGVWASDVKNGAGYSSPIVAEVEGKRQIIQMLAGKGREGLMVGLDAKTGKGLWSTSKGVANITCCTPVYYDGVAVATSGYGQGTGGYDVAKKREAWFIDSQGSHHGGIIRLGDYIYGFIDRMTCIELKSGAIKWQEGGIGKGSLTYADGMFYCLSENQTVGLVEATPDGYREKGRFKIPGSGKPSWTHPVVCGGRLLIRDQDTLACWDVKAK